MTTSLQYDGTFEGFLSCVFYVYEFKLTEVDIQKEKTATATIFDTTVKIYSEEKKANRVWKGLSKYSKPATLKDIYRVFLSEMPQIENRLLYYIQMLISSEGKIANNYTDPQILKIAKVNKMVRREKHRMDAFIRFRLTKDGIYFATVEPDFNVLPLIINHFKNRYADQKWLIYNLKRNFGIYYDLNTVETIKLEAMEDVNSERLASLIFTSEELEFQSLWQQYFKSTSIASRKNMKLHIRHVPKRYWKYLSEKAP